MGYKSDNNAREAFRSLLLIRQHVPTSPEFQEFDRVVQATAIREFNKSIPPFEEVNVHSMGFHDAIVTYGTVLSEAIADGEDIFNGRQMLRRFTNRTFMGIRGPLPLDNLNNLNGHYELWNFRFACGNFVKVIDFPESVSAIEPYSDIEWPSPDGPPPDVPYCGFEGNDPICVIKEQSALIIGLCVSLITVVIVLVTGYIVARYQKLSNQDVWWKVTANELIAHKKNKDPSCPVVFRQRDVHLTPTSLLHLTPKALVELSRLRNTKCEKLVQIFGICTDPDRHVIISEYCSRGSLYDLVRSADTFLVDWNFRFSVLRDLIEGLVFIHNSWIYCHGTLRSSSCYLNSRFELKISDYTLRDLVKHNQHFSTSRMWTPPEMLGKKTEPSNFLRRRADVYSFAIILSEVCLLSDIFMFEDSADSSSDYVKSGGRPDLQHLKSAEPYIHLAFLAEVSWSASLNERPTMQDIQKRFARITGLEVTIVDDLLHRMTHRANELEDIVTDRTTALMREKRENEALLFAILPRTVALDLIAGIPVQPDLYESATVLFSAIEGFSDIAARSTPWDLITMIHSLYTMIDNGIEKFDVYKVETINDAYMLTSGIPMRNGLTHVVEIANCALYLRKSSKQIKISAEMRSAINGIKFLIGFHTGPIMTGVIGRKMPRFCLFGDVVNTASRMESTSEGGKIQITEHSMSLLMKVTDRFLFEPRGEIFVKGKGNMRTCWLLKTVNKPPSLDELDPDVELVVPEILKHF